MRSNEFRRWVLIGLISGGLLLPAGALSVSTPRSGLLVDVTVVNDRQLLAVGVDPGSGRSGLGGYPLLIGDANTWRRVSGLASRPWDEAFPFAVRVTRLRNGQTLVVWSAKDGVKWATLGSDFTVTRTAPIPGAGTTPQGASLALRATPDDRAVLLWVSGGSVNAAVFNGGDGTWDVQGPLGKAGTQPGVITPGSTQPVDLQMSADGTMTAVWQHVFPRPSRLMTSLATAAGGYKFAGSSTVPGTLGAGISGGSSALSSVDRPRLLVAPNGSAIAVWDRGAILPRRKGGMILSRNYFAVRSSTGRWSKPRLLPHAVVATRKPLRRINGLVPIVGRGGGFSIVGVSSGEGDAPKSPSEVVVLRVSPAGIAQPKFRIVARQSRIYYLAASATTAGKEVVVFSGNVANGRPSPLRRLVGVGGTWRAAPNLRPPQSRLFVLGSFVRVDVWPLGSRVLATWSEIAGAHRTALM